MHRAVARRVFLALVLGATSAGAQATIPVGATVTGTVRERLADVPLGLATVSLEGTDRVVFTRGGGAFAIAGVSPGPHTLRIRQIGFAPATVRVTVPDTGSVDVGVTRLERLAVSLASIEVRAQPSECVGTGLSDPGADSMVTVLLVRIADQSDRLRAFAATYPGETIFENVREHLSSDSAVLETKTDTARRFIVDARPYRVGEVTRKRSRLHVAVQLPTAAQLSSADFVSHHCARYAGTRTINGVLLDVLEIAPTSSVRTPDVAGTVLLTREGLLRRTELRLTRIDDINFGLAGGGMRSFAVTSDYRPILGDRVSIMTSFVALQETRSPYIAGHHLTRLRDRNRALWYRYAGARPDADTARVTPR